jgi:glycosyltransferase involved in cell wall biosynthesis
MMALTEEVTSVVHVSVGLPVWNGERFVEDAIRSVLAQTYDDLELVICDNASTDRTAEICRDLAAGDRRVRVLSNQENLGAAFNYNRVFAESRGRYFKWLAHDDRLLPGYVAATVAALEARPDAVLCNTLVDYIDAAGQRIATYDSGIGRADHANVAERLAVVVLHSHSCVDFFGTIRHAALVDSDLHGTYHGADRVLLAQLALRGRLLQLPTPLVEMREHPNRYTRRRGSVRARQRWHGSNGPTIRLPSWHVYRTYWRLVAEELADPVERAACRRLLMRWWVANWNATRLVADAADFLVPGAVSFAERAKALLFGRAPGHFPER